MPGRSWDGVILCPDGKFRPVRFPGAVSFPTAHGVGRVGGKRGGGGWRGGGEREKKKKKKKKSKLPTRSPLDA